MQVNNSNEYNSLSKEDIIQFKNTRWKIKREYGDFGLLRLHQFFDGNATAAAEFLGFKRHSPVSLEWSKLGLMCLGKEKPRTFESSNRPPDVLDKLLLSSSTEPEYAFKYNWELPSKYNVGRIQMISDIHLQSKQCAYSRLKELIQWISERDWVRFVLLGDLFNMNTRSSPGNSADENMNLTEAIDLATYIFEPISWQCIGIFSGNHEVRLLKNEDVVWNPCEQLAKNINVPYLGFYKHVIINIGNETYTIFFHHGRGSSNTKGGKLNAGLKILETTSSELVVVGHVHTEMAVKIHKQDIDLLTNEITTQTQRLVICPSFLRYGGYAAQHGLSVESIGTIGIEFSANEHQIRIIE